MSDDLPIEEVRMRATQEKMNDAFRNAMRRALKAGQEFVPTLFPRSLAREAQE